MHAASVCPEPGSNSPTKQRTVLTERSLQASSSIQKIDESALCVPATLQLLKIVPFASHAEMATGVMRTLIVPRLAFQRQRVIEPATLVFRVRPRTHETTARPEWFHPVAASRRPAAATDASLEAAPAL